MTMAEVLEQRRKVVQQELECWSAVREVLHKRIVTHEPSASLILPYVQALEIAVNAEGRALEHIDQAYKAVVEGA